MTAAQSANQSPQHRAAHAADAKPRVLVVEDHEDTRFLIKYMLTTRGFDVLEAANGEEALDMAERLRPGLIFMDGSLPRLDGLATTRRMRDLATLRKVPIIFLSGHAEPTWQVQARASGCDDFLLKPLDIDQLERVLAHHLAPENTARPERI